MTESLVTSVFFWTFYPKKKLKGDIFWGKNRREAPKNFGVFSFFGVFIRREAPEFFFGAKSGKFGGFSFFLGFFVAI